jgi:MFS family permease
MSADRRLLARLGSMLPDSQAGRRLVAVAGIDSMGTGVFLTGSALFFVRAVGLPAAQVGAGLAVAAGVGFVTTVPLGVLADRFGARRMLIVLHLWRACWFAALCLVRSLPAFVAVSACIAIADRSVSPVTRAVVTDAVGEGARTRTLAMMRSVRNVGFSIGAGAAAPLLSVGTPTALRTMILLDAVSFLAAAAVLAFAVHPRAERIRLPSPTGPSRRALWDRPYLALTALDGALSLHVTLLGLALPLWVAARPGLPVTLVSGLVLVNTVMAVLLQVPISRGGDTLPAGLAAMRKAGLALAACCLLLAAGQGRSAAWTGAAAVGAVVALTLGELWQAVASWTLSYRYARADHQAEYLAVFSLGLTAQEVLGPPLVLRVVLPHGPAGLGVLALVLAVLPVAARPVVATLERRRVVPAVEKGLP